MSGICSTGLNTLNRLENVLANWQPQLESEGEMLDETMECRRK